MDDYGATLRIGWLNYAVCRVVMKSTLHPVVRFMADNDLPNAIAYGITEISPGFTDAGKIAFIELLFRLSCDSSNVVQKPSIS